jgi:hypothetical protein
VSLGAPLVAQCSGVRQTHDAALQIDLSMGAT